MACVVLRDGSISKNQEKILQVQAQFYQKLYSSDPEILRLLIMHKSSDEEKLDFDRLLTLDEVTLSLKSLRAGRTPEADGIPPESTR